MIENAAAVRADIARQIRMEMVAGAAVDGIEFDGEQLDFVLQALDDAVQEILNRLQSGQLAALLARVEGATDPPQEATRDDGWEHIADIVYDRKTQTVRYERPPVTPQDATTALIEQWRKRALDCRETGEDAERKGNWVTAAGEIHHAVATEDCADELEALRADHVAALSSQAPPDTFDLEARLAAEKLRSAALQESIDGCAKRVAELKAQAPPQAWRDIASAPKLRPVLVYMKGTAGLGIYRAILGAWDASWEPKDRPLTRWRPCGYTALDEFPKSADIIGWQPLPPPPADRIDPSSARNAEE